MKSTRQFLMRSTGAWHVIIALLALCTMLPAMTNTARAAGTATITVKSFEADGTTPLPFARFQVTDSNNADYGKLESAPGSGEAVFTVDLSSDNLTFTIAMETPPACGVAEAPKTVSKLKDGDNKAVTFKTSFDPNCALGSISVYSYACPASVNGSSSNYADYQSTCTDALNGATFNVASANASDGPWSIVTGAWGVSGRAPLIGLNAGDYTVADAANPKPLVFCANYPLDPAGQSTGGQANQASVKTGAVTVSVNNDRVSCDFFTVANATGGNGTDAGNSTGNGADAGNASGNGSGNGIVSPSAAGTASIEVHLSACPDGYTGTAYYNDCHGNGLAGHTVAVTNQDGLNNTAVTATPATPGPGVAKFENLAAGKYFVSQDIPGNTDTYFVFCSKAENNDVVPFKYNDSQAEGFDISLTKGLHVVCDFSIVPNPQFAPAAITVLKYTCDAGYDASGKSYDNFKADCPSKTDGVTFSLSVQGGGAPTTGKTGDSGSGEAVFSALSPAAYQLSEDVSGDSSAPHVYCSADGNSWAKKTLSSGEAASFKIDGSGQNITCRWFNVPAAPPPPPPATGSLTINKWQCPAGLTTGYYDNCHGKPVSGVTFNVTGPSSYNTSNLTNSKGAVVFDTLAAGNYAVTETPPDSPHTAVYVVLCTQNGKDFAKTYDDSTSLQIKFKLPAAANVVCDWYNVPPAPPTPTPSPAPSLKGSITVAKYLCQGKTANAYNWAKDCTNYGAGADFTLTATADGATYTGTTNANGQLVFSGLANATYALEETNGSWCHAEADNVDASGNLKVLSSANTTVSIYNCTKKTVTVLPATGVGPVPTSPASGVLMDVFGLAGLGFLMLVRKVRSAKLVAARSR